MVLSGLCCVHSAVWVVLSRRWLPGIGGPNHGPGHRLPGLEPDEQLLAHAPASFRGAMAASVRSTVALSAARRRLEAYYAWRAHADSVGFTTMGPVELLA